MVSRRLRWLSAAAVLPLLLVALSAPLLAVQCRVTGVVVRTCCCPGEHQVAPAAEIGAQSCCRLHKTDIPRLTSEAPSPVRLAVPIESVEVAPAPVLYALALEPGDEPIPRPPLLLIKRVFLI
jgi:hypothetical protein